MLTKKEGKVNIWHHVSNAEIAVCREGLHVPYRWSWSEMFAWPEPQPLRAPRGFGRGHGRCKDRCADAQGLDRTGEPDQGWGGFLWKERPGALRTKTNQTDSQPYKKARGQEIQHVFDRNLYNGHGVWHKLGDHQSYSHRTIGIHNRMQIESPTGSLGMPLWVTSWWLGTSLVRFCNYGLRALTQTCKKVWVKIVVSSAPWLKHPSFGCEDEAKSCENIRNSFGHRGFLYR